MMKKEFKMCPVTKFVAWLVLGLIVCIIGISNVFADTFSYSQFTAQLYDNFGPTLSAVTTDLTNGRWQGAIPTMTANSSGAGWGISSNMVLLANHTYTLTAEITGTYGGRLVLSTYNRIGVGTTLANAKTSYQNNTYVTENYSRVLDNGYTIQFAFTPTTNGSYIVFPFATNYTGSNQYFYLSSYTLDDLGASGGVSQSDINNSLNNQTSTLNQSIINSQNAITSNADTNRDLIIQNQNENTNNQIIADSNNARQQEVNNCTNAYMFNLKSGYTINASNTLVANSNAYYTEEYVTIHSNVTQLIIKNTVRTTGYFILVYDNSKNVLDYWYAEDSRVITLPSGASYFRLASTNANVMIYDGNKGCNNRLGAILDNITDDSSATFDSSMINLIPNAPITNLLTIPISLMQSILTKTNNNCSPISIPFLYNTTIDFPCFTISDYLGNASNIIDMCICFVMIYNILMLFVSVFEDITSLRDEFHTLYAPRQLQLKIK